MDTKECREAFEAWFAGQYGDDPLCEAADDKEFLWEAYRAAWNRRADAQEAAVVEAARNLVAQKGRHNTEVAYQRLVAAIAGEKKE